LLRVGTARNLLLLSTIAGALALPATAPAHVSWLCRPGQADNPCTPSLTTTVFSSSGKRVGVLHPKAEKHPKIDCFYVYPTVSNQNGETATKARDPEIRDIALFQAARYSQVCRVFAPLYRQITVPALQRRDFTAEDSAIGAADVLEAWKHYLRKYNKGRGIVLIGHSQGTFRLIDLIQKQIDKKPAVRRRIVSAILLGGNVTVRKGSDRGGSFRNMRACRRTRQTGCVVAFSAFNETPPPNTLFGHSLDPELQVLCTNPAALGGGSAKLDSISPSKQYAPGTLISAGIQLLDFPLPKASTTFIESRGAFSGRCADEGGAQFLKVTSQPGTPTPKPSPDPSWGLHLLDANIAQGNLLRLIRAQTKAFYR
jgi:Protein of unknown function (DUF3089)